MIGVLVVDDSPVVRQLLQELLAGSGDIEVIATASDPIFAMRKMRQRWPDVIVLDLQMPRMDGITFLKQIMAIRPTPVIICSMLTEGGAALGAEALAAGAVGIITKPELGVRDFLHHSVDALANAIRAADATRHGGPVRTPPSAPPPQTGGIDSGPRHSADVVLAAPAASDGAEPATCPVVAMGASTGGPQALETVLSGLTPRCPGIVVVQHMPPHFTGSFAQRLDSICAVDVREARHLDRVRAGQVLIAPGGMHLMLRRDGLQYYVEVVGGPLVSRHKPSVDVLFRSVAKAAGANAMGIIMTGMGDDGARGLKEMAERGAVTYAQDESSSVVFGMPKEAIQLGGVGGVISLANISAVIEHYGYREPE